MKPTIATLLAAFFLVLASAAQAQVSLKDKAQLVTALSAGQPQPAASARFWQMPRSGAPT